MSADEPLRAVAGVTSTAEAELIRNLLLEEGIAGIIQPRDMYAATVLASGSQAVLVPESRYEEARAIIYGSPLQGAKPPPTEGTAGGYPGRPLLIAIFVGLLVVGAVLLVFSAKP